MITALDALSANWGGDPDAPHAPEAVLIWSIEDPLNPQQVGSFTTGGGTHRNGYFGGRYMHLAATSRGRALDYFCTHGGRFGPHNQNQLQHNPLVKNQDDLVYLTWFNAGLRIYDISTPINPQEVGWYPAPGSQGAPRPAGAEAVRFDVEVREDVLGGTSWGLAAMRDAVSMQKVVWNPRPRSGT